MLICFVFFRWTLQNNSKYSFITNETHLKVEKDFDALKTNVIDLFKKYDECWGSYKNKMKGETAQKYFTEEKLKEVHDQIKEKVWYLILSKS